MAVVIGDIHGKFKDLYEQLNRRQDTLRETDIFALGDVNVGYYPEFENNELWPAVNTIMEELNSMFYVVRGNHDNPNWFDGKHNLKRVIFLEDYSIVKTTDVDGDKVNALILGGGISINRTSKRFIEGKNYFKDEVFNLDTDFLNDVKDIDIILSHNCPWFIPPIGINSLIESWAAQDPTLTYDLRHEREKISSAYNILINNNNIKRWYYGHMHHSSRVQYNNTEFICSEELEFNEIWK